MDYLTDQPGVVENRAARRSKAALSPSKHHWLVSGKIVYEVDENSINSIELNAIITADVQKITTKELGKAQQALQLHFRQRTQSTVEVADIFISQLSYLGYMTEAEFNPEKKAN